MLATSLPPTQRTTGPLPIVRAPASGRLAIGGVLVALAWVLGLIALEPDRPILAAAGGVGAILVVGVVARRLARRAHAGPETVGSGSAVGAGSSAAIDARVVAELIPKLLVGSDGIVRSADASLETLLGYPTDVIVGDRLAAIIPPGAAAAVLDVARAEAEARARIETTMLLGDGGWLPVELDVLRDGARDGSLAVAVHDVRHWRAREAELTDRAFHDPLTRLPNRALFIDRLEHALDGRRRHSRGTAVLFLDLDDFKTVNESLGHVDADTALALVAERLLSSIRPEDTAGRLGGDEFAMLLDDIDVDEAETVAARILRALDVPLKLPHRAVRIGGSIGLAHTESGLMTSADLLRAADIAMYHAKESGKNQLSTFDPSMGHASAERLSLGIDLRGALDRGELVLHYQPIVALPELTPIAMEALIRWRHPERGLVAPGEFIPIAERTGLMVPIGEFVLREACRQAQAWRIARPDQPAIAVSVNVSGVQLQHPGLVAAVSLALEDSGLPPELLTLEITESAVARETDATARRLRQLDGLGVSLAIDDFGTGYSALSYLNRFPISIVKIDKSFIAAMGDDAAGRALTRGIVQLAHSVRTITVAEGVETDAQLRSLIKMRCDRAQGFLFARPMDAQAATEYVIGRTILQVLVGHSGPELAVIRAVAEAFETIDPSVRVEVTGGATDERIREALASADPPAAICSFESDAFSATEAVDRLVDLAPLLHRDGISEAEFVPATLAYTGDDRGRWALPLLADTYGLLYNRALFAEAGISAPPRTIDELTELAKRLTIRNPDGSLRVVGFDPTIGFYENSVAALGHLFGARWQVDGRSSLSADPAWARFLRWQRELVEWYGRADLDAFHARIGEEFSTRNAFQTGQLAMCLDGEWRIAFIAVEADGLDYGTAPLPVDAARPELYGSGFINGSVIGIPARARHRDAAWRLVRHLTTDETALATLSNGLRNVPSTRTSLRSPALLPDDRFAVFLGIFDHPRSTTAPLTRIGSSYQGLFHDLAAAWQEGTIDDLDEALERLDRTIDARIEASATEPLRAA